MCPQHHSLSCARASPTRYVVDQLVAGRVQLLEIDDEGVDRVTLYAATLEVVERF
jgi:hypothetical protein